jgi:hypothetical protein
MKQVSFADYMNENNPWVERLLGEEQSFQKTRNISQIEKEYNAGIYAKRLQLVMDDPEGFRKNTVYAETKDLIYASIGTDIYHMSSGLFAAAKRNMMLEIIEKYVKAGNICELGAGSGQNLVWLRERQKLPVYGGEYSENAVKIGKLLDLEVYGFNYYEENDYSFIRPDSNIITVHSIEQIPDASIIIDTLRKIKDKINLVIHFEPLFIDSRKDLIGTLRNKYIKVNDYNRNLLQIVENSSDIEILHRQFDVLGNNPLNPTSVLVWKFK